jgi:GNAT superfamily N-acetyltransferase
MARSDGPRRTRPEGMTDATVAALGKLSEALETVEYARGQLYEFHRRSGTADRLLQEAVDELAEAGHAELAEELTRRLVGRDVLPGMWTFQMIEGYEEQYWSVFRELEQRARDSLGAPRHLYEAEMKYREQQP